jgi:hypothetical protein
LQQLRQEAGYLDVEDEAKIDAMLVSSAEDLTWKWKLHLPKGKLYRLNIAKAAIDDSGYPAATAYSPIYGNGIRVMTISLRKNRRNQWEVVIPGFLRTPISPSDAEWIESGVAYSSTGVQDSQSYDDSCAVELLRLRAYQREGPTTQTLSNRGPHPGLLIWLSPETRTIPVGQSETWDIPPSDDGL